MARHLLAESRSHRLRTILVTVVVCGFLIALIMATLHSSAPTPANGAFPCDSYLLTVSLPAGYIAAHPNSGVKVTMSWTDTGTRQSDYDLYIFNGADPSVDGNHQADHQSTSGANPEVAVINPLLDG